MALSVMVSLGPGCARAKWCLSRALLQRLQRDGVKRTILSYLIPNRTPLRTFQNHSSIACMTKRGGCRLDRGAPPAVAVADDNDDNAAAADVATAREKVRTTPITGEGSVGDDSPQAVAAVQCLERLGGAGHPREAVSDEVVEHDLARLHLVDEHRAVQGNPGPNA